MRVQTKGEFGGLGIEVTQENGFVKVVAPIEGTPADRAGVEPGDFITHVDGESVLGLTLNEAVDLMRGPVGSEITITLTREGSEEPFDVKHHARDDHHRGGALAARGRRRRAAADHLQRADLPRPRGAARRAGRGGGRHGEGDGLRHRPAQQPRRAPEPGDLGHRRVPRVRARSSRPAAATRATASATTRRRAT